MTFDVRTLDTINQLPEISAFATEKNIYTICVQEHREDEEFGNEWTCVGINRDAAQFTCFKITKNY